MSRIFFICENFFGPIFFARENKFAIFFSAKVFSPEIFAFENF